MCLLLVTHLMYSQETISTSGGEATSNEGYSSYSVGQLVYTTHIGNGTVSQGVQQAIELFALSNPELTALTLKAVTYPNPTTDYIILALKGSNFIGLSFEMYDILGRSVAKGKIEQADTHITMQILPSATYILKVNQNNRELKTFKIIKK